MCESVPARGDDIVRFLQPGTTAPRGDVREPMRTRPVLCDIGLLSHKGAHMDAVLRDRAGLLCDQLSRWPSLYTTAREVGRQTELAELLTLVTGPREPDQDRVLELLNSIDKAFAGVGLAGLTSRTKGPDVGLTLPEGLKTAPGLVGWTCPLKRCGRVVICQEADGAPACAAARDAPMAAYVLPPQ